MKQLLEFLPLLAFFISYYLFDVYVATGTLIVATAVQLLLLKLLFGSIARNNWIIFAIILCFGSLTLYLQNDDFIKWKATIIYSVFACVMIIYQRIGKSIPKKMMGKDIKAPDAVWRNVSYAWGLTCIGAAILNYFVAFNLSLDTWVNFKVFGLTGLTFLLFICTGIYLFKYMPEENDQENS